MPSLFIAKDGSTSIQVNVLVLKDLRERARQEGISLSKVVNDALKERFQKEGEGA